MKVEDVLQVLIAMAMLLISLLSFVVSIVVSITK